MLNFRSKLPNWTQTVQQQRKKSQQSRRQKVQPSATRGSRLSIAFVIVSSLVVCSLLAAGLIGAVQLDLFGLGDDEPDANIEDANEDVVAAQQTNVAENPDDYESLVLLANVLGNSNRLPEAIPLYEKAIQQRPDDVVTRLDFARALSDGGNHADAEVQFRKVIELEPDNQSAIYYLAELYRTATPTRIDEAIPLYLRVVEIDSQSFLAEQATNQLRSLGIQASPPSSSASPAAEATP